MGNLQAFDVSNVAPSDAFDVLPAGKYRACVVGSEMKPTNAGTGHYLSLTFQVLDGQYQNRKLWVNLNLDNPNATAVEIAKADLKAICLAVGVPNPNDSSELHDKPMLISVKVKKNSRSGEDENVIKGYTSAKAGPATQQVATQQAQQPAGPGAWAATVG